MSVLFTATVVADTWPYHCCDHSRSKLYITAFKTDNKTCCSLAQNQTPPMICLQGPQAAAANLSMDVSIQGLGPRFRLLINLSNEGQELAMDLQVSTCRLLLHA